MFRADLAWAGPLLGVAALALRTYLKGRTMNEEVVQDPRLKLIRDGIWSTRTEYLDALLLHTCPVKQHAEAMLWLVAWDVEEFVLAALREDRSHLGD